MVRRPLLATATLLVLAALAAGCSGPVATRPPARRTVASTTSRSATTPGSPGCGRAPRPAATAPGGDPESLEVAGRRRTYLLSVPAGYRRSQPAALVLLFHGWASNARQISTVTGLPRAATGAGYLVAAPDAVAGSWELSAPGAHTPDLGFVARLITSISDRYCVDPRRVYAAGFSLGSQFAAIVGCTFPDRIAAIGLVAAEFLIEPCRRTIPVVAFHGTADPAVAYAPGAVGLSLPGVHVPGVVNNLKQWAALDRCSPRPVLVRLARRVLRRTWPACAPGDTVQLYTIVGGGHTWPGSHVVDGGGIGLTTHEVSATATILRFFAGHKLAAAAAR